MATLASRITDLATRIATECKSLRTLLNGNAADLSALTTTAKTNLVAAVNEIDADLGTLSTAVSNLSNGASADSPAFTGIPTAPTADVNTNTTQLATTAFVQSAVGGYLSKAVTGGLVTLTDAEASNPVIALSGTLTVNQILIVPAAVKRLWAIYNGTSGAFTLTVKTANGTGVTVAQGKRNLVYTDGTNVYDGFNDFESVDLTGAPTTPTAAADTNTTQVASTAFVVGQAATVAPVVDGVAAVGTSKKFARQDHVHPTDTTRAPVASPTFTGVPAAPTATAGTNTTQVATTAFAMTAAANAVAAMINSAPAALDTLNELAAALGNDANFATTINTALGYRLRYDAAQALTAEQKTRACTNIGVGEPDTDFVTTFNTGLV